MALCTGALVSTDSLTSPEDPQGTPYFRKHPLRARVTQTAVIILYQELDSRVTGI